MRDKLNEMISDPGGNQDKNEVSGATGLQRDRWET